MNLCPHSAGTGLLWGTPLTPAAGQSPEEPLLQGVSWEGRCQTRDHRGLQLSFIGEPRICAAANLQRQTATATLLRAGGHGHSDMPRGKAEFPQPGLRSPNPRSQGVPACSSHAVLGMQPAPKALFSGKGQSLHSYQLWDESKSNV